MKKIRFSLTILFILAFSLGCQPATAPANQMVDNPVAGPTSTLAASSSQPAVETAGIKQPKPEELIIWTNLQHGMEDGIDPIYDWGAYGESLVFSSLLYRDQDMNVTKDLATDYSVSEDGLVWTVKLRRDASFTDGTPVTARDVVYTYNSLPDITLCKLYCFI